MRLLPALLALAAVALAGCSGGQDGGDAPPTEVKDVAIHGNQYDPQSVSLAAGGTLRFENHDTARHTAQTQDLRYDTGDIATNQAKSIEGLPAGTYQFTCKYHPAMRLTVNVA